MVKSRAEPMYQIASKSESEEPEEANDGGSPIERSKSDSVTLVVSDEDPKVEFASVDEEEERGSSESDDLHMNLKSLISKPLKSSFLKPASELDTVPHVLSKPVSLKRGQGNLKESMAKKAKQMVLFQRLWSEEDEIVILKRMINYIAEKNADPLADLNAFHLFLDKGVQHIDASRVQLQRKIRRMRSKFLNNKRKEKDGKDRTFSKPHEQEAYLLSKMIWNSEGEVLGNSIAEGGALLKKRKALEEFNAVEGNDVKFVRVLYEKNNDVSQYM